MGRLERERESETERDPILVGGWLVPPCLPPSVLSASAAAENNPYNLSLFLFSEFSASSSLSTPPPFSFSLKVAFVLVWKKKKQTKHLTPVLVFLPSTPSKFEDDKLPNDFHALYLSGKITPPIANYILESDNVFCVSVTKEVRREEQVDLFLFPSDRRGLFFFLSLRSVE